MCKDKLRQKYGLRVPAKVAKTELLDHILANKGSRVKNEEALSIFLCSED